jgi:hypothetical protein
METNRLEPLHAQAKRPKNLVPTAPLARPICGQLIPSEDAVEESAYRLVVILSQCAWECWRSLLWIEGVGCFYRGGLGTIG